MATGTQRRHYSRRRRFSERLGTEMRNQTHRRFKSACTRRHARLCVNAGVCARTRVYPWGAHRFQDSRCRPAVCVCVTTSERMH
ncbi:unnamed protein product [Rangifer tarandus platyrhynchus]|uniref:Uncharacterized protein n=1 Tax=Rangifer tarandus platyrhynchus TaxID=3082113 RepID=A0AC59Y5B8_RANTA